MSHGPESANRLTPRDRRRVARKVSRPCDIRSRNRTPDARVLANVHFATLSNGTVSLIARLELDQHDEPGALRICGPYVSPESRWLVPAAPSLYRDRTAGCGVRTSPPDCSQSWVSQTDSANGQVRKPAAGPMWCSVRPGRRHRCRRLSLQRGSAEPATIPSYGLLAALTADAYAVMNSHSALGKSEDRACGAVSCAAELWRSYLGHPVRSGLPRRCRQSAGATGDSGS